MRQEDGFSLIELLIVIAVILIIAAIAIPQLLRSRIAANEASAVSSLRVISTAEATYHTTYGIGYAPLNNLGGPDPCTASRNTACLVDSSLSVAQFKSGYRFSMPVPGAVGTTASPNTQYQAHADPQVRGQSGNRSFYCDETRVVRFNTTTAATSAKVAVQ